MKMKYWFSKVLAPVVLMTALLTVAIATSYTITASMSATSVASQDYEKVGLYISCTSGSAIKGYITRCNSGGTVLETYTTKSASYASGTLYWQIPWTNIASGYRARGYAYAKIGGTWYKRSGYASVALA